MSAAQKISVPKQNEKCKYRNKCDLNSRKLMFIQAYPIAETNINAEASGIALMPILMSREKL